jgi:hypothetical protein
MVGVLYTKAYPKKEGGDAKGAWQKRYISDETH